MTTAAVPLLTAGPEVPSGAVCAAPVSLVDCFPSVIEAVGARAHSDDGKLPGCSLWSSARGGAPGRALLGEYHAVGSRGASFMIREGRYKDIHYLLCSAQLFDLADDPDKPLWLWMQARPLSPAIQSVTVCWFPK